MSECYDALLFFARRMLSVPPGTDFDGGDLQDAAVEFGLLETVEVHESCGDNCLCAEFGFPQTCYRKAAWLRDG